MCFYPSFFSLSVGEEMWYPLIPPRFPPRDFLESLSPLFCTDFRGAHATFMVRSCPSAPRTPPPPLCRLSPDPPPHPDRCFVLLPRRFWASLSEITGTCLRTLLDFRDSQFRFLTNLRYWSFEFKGRRLSSWLSNF